MKNSSLAPGDPPKVLLDPGSLYKSLRDHHNFDETWPNGDWPVRGGFRPAWLEIAVGAVLTQNTRWENVESTLGALRRAGLVDLASILSAADSEIETAVRSSGFFRQKGATLRRLARYLAESGHQEVTRAGLLSLKGIGPETADSILLFAFGRPEFVIDAYTVRLLERLGWADKGYAALKKKFEAELPSDVALFRAYHALIVQHGKRHCRRRPVCSECPLRPACPAGYR